MITDFRDDLDRPAVRLLLVLSAFAVLWPLWLKTPLWIGAFSAFALLVAARPKLRINRWVLMGLTLAATLGIVVQHRALFSREAGLSLIVLMSSFKLLELKGVRDALLIIAVGFLLQFVGFLFWTTLAMSLWLLATVPLLTLALLVLNDREGWNGVKRLSKDSGRVLLFALPLMAVLYVFFPRLNVPLWRLPGGASSGLSDEMSIGDVMTLSLSTDPAFRIKFDGPLPPRDQLYFRALTLSDYDGYTWRRRNLPRESLQALSEPLHYQMLREPRNTTWLTALDMPVTGPSQARVDGDGSLRLLIPDRVRTEYRFSSALKYRLGSTLSEEARRAYLQIPAGNNPRTRNWAETQRAQVADDNAFVQFLLQHIRQNDFWYTLTPPLFAENIIDDFWFNQSRGFCEHYANAFAFLLRAGGVPARIVTGYQGGEWNRFGAFLLVTDADAHAWVEYWRDDAGWVRVDPTAAIAPQRIEPDLRQRLRGRDDVLSPADWSRLTEESEGWLQGVYTQWRQANAWFDAHVVQFNDTAQQSLLNTLGLPTLDRQTLGQISIFSTLGLVGIGGLWLWHTRPRRDRAGRIWLALLAKLQRSGLEVQPGDAPLALKARAMRAFPLHRAALARVFDAYTAHRYAGADERALRQHWRALRFVRLRVRPAQAEDDHG